MVADTLQESGISVLDKSPDHFPLKNLSPAYRHFIRNFSVIYAEFSLISFKLNVYMIRTNSI